MISLIIPMYNEERILPDTLRELRAFCDAEGVEELIFADDGSTDGSAALVEAAAAEDGRIRLISCPHRGKGAAVRSGMLESRGDTVLFTDCDLAYGTEQLSGILRAHRDGDKPITVGVRTLGSESFEGYSLLRRVGSEGLRWLIRLRTGLRVSDMQAGLKCFDGDVAHALFAECRTEGFAFDTEILLLARRRGVAVGEYPVKILPGGGEHRSSVHPVRDAISLLREIGKM